MTMSNNGENHAKRQAMTGQWRTPPLPSFVQQQQQQQQQQTDQQQQQQQQQAHQGIQNNQQQQQQQQAPPNPLSEVFLPESTDDYAKALQEAYRRGAEAAARLQQQQQLSSSCPNLQHYKNGQPPPPQIHTIQQPRPLTQPPPPQRVIPPPPPPTTTTTATTATTVAAVAPSLVPNPLATDSTMAPSILQQQQTNPAPFPTTIPSSAAARSLSLPDMQSFAVRAQAEEEKRKKRLARNRASARLRRLRKKNLVESYEGEVGVLEASIQKLKSHNWGDGNHEALLEALSMERGQQELTNKERCQLIQDILKQQLEQLEFLREAQREHEMLLAVASRNPNNQNNNNELELELQTLLQLTPQQEQEICNACRDLDHQVRATETFIACLKAMQDKTWLWNEGVNQMAAQFTSILHPNQLSKFLLWTDANAEALDALELCRAPLANAPVPTAPIFVFGMDDHNNNNNNASGIGGNNTNHQ